MAEKSLLDRLLDDDDFENIKLMNEDGEEEELEQIGVVSHESGYYALLRPLDLEENQVVVFRIVEDDDERLDLVTDEELAKKVLDLYQNSIKEEEEDVDGGN